MTVNARSTSPRMWGGARTAFQRWASLLAHRLLGLPPSCFGSSAQETWTEEHHHYGSIHSRVRGGSLSEGSSSHVGVSASHLHGRWLPPPAPPSPHSPSIHPFTPLYTLLHCFTRGDCVSEKE